ncbi:hypothetical protein [Flectobacillus roseus]|uniref:hypothetical protein n=1 Tax=Flectobacillus roseus TaxID=502259 RepID=UPI0024B6C5E3|nr:hypothetical protein [Flectobacillus roseus]MDI9872703.1 hypothetical protein [Flectobacillus roseus]
MIQIFQSVSIFDSNITHQVHTLVDFTSFLLPISNGSALRPQRRALKIGSNLIYLKMAKLTKAEKLMFLKIFEKCTFQIEYELEDIIAGSDDVPEEQPYIKADMEMLSHIKMLNNWILTYCK